MKRLLLYAAAGGVLITLLRVIEYRHLVQAWPGAWYGGVVAAIFAAAGIWLGLKSARPRQVVVVREVARPAGAPFSVNEAKLRELGITPREFEILERIAEGLSNREIAERLFVSENTVKTHSSRLFDKMGVRRRVQAVQQGREWGLIP